MRFWILLYVITVCLLGAIGIAEEQHQPSLQRVQALPKNPNYAAISWILFDDRQDFRDWPELTRNLFCHNTSCAVPIPPENFASLGLKEGLSDFSKQVEASLVLLKDQANPRLFVFIGSHGKKGIICQQDKPDISHKDFLKNLFDRVSDFEKKYGKPVGVSLIYDACHSASLSEAADVYLEDKEGKYRGARGKTYKHAITIFAASTPDRPAKGNDFMNSMRAITEHNRKENRPGELLSLEDVVALSTKGRATTGRPAVFSTEEDLAHYGLKDLETNKTPLVGTIHDFIPTIEDKDRDRVEAARPAVALKILKEQGDLQKACEYLTRLIKVFDKKENEMALFGQEAKQKKEMAKLFARTFHELDQECRFQDKPHTLTERFLPWLSDAYAPFSYKKTVLEFLKIRAASHKLPDATFEIVAHFLEKSEFEEIPIKILAKLPNGKDKLEAMIQDSKANIEKRIGILRYPYLLKDSPNGAKLFVSSKEIWEEQLKKWNPQNKALDSVVRSLAYFGKTEEEKQFARDAFLKLWDDLLYDGGRQALLFLRSGEEAKVLFPELKFELLLERNQILKRLNVSSSLYKKLPEGHTEKTRLIADIASDTYKLIFNSSDLKSNLPIPVFY